jgi:hypothetical protein
MNGRRQESAGRLREWSGPKCIAALRINRSWRGLLRTTRSESVGRGFEPRPPHTPSTQVEVYFTGCGRSIQLAKLAFRHANLTQPIATTNGAKRPRQTPLTDRRWRPDAVPIWASNRRPESAVLGKTRGGLNAENRLGARPSIPDATTEPRQDNAAFVVTREPKLVGFAHAVG